MLEPDIARKCGILLAVFAAAAVLSVAGSRWVMSRLSFSPVASGAMNPKSGEGPVPDRDLGGSVPAVNGTGPVEVRRELPAGAPERKAEQDQWERRAFELEMDNARLRGRLDDMLNWILENVRGNFPLPEGQMAHLRLEPVNEDVSVSDDLIEVLRMNEEEVQRLDAAFQGTRSVLQDIEVESISVEEPAENQVRLNIPPYAEEGQMVRDELYSELRRTLGPARFARFLQVAGEGLDQQFEYFGDVDRTLRFEAVLDAVTGFSQLFVRDERVVPHKDDPLRQDIIASERVVTELPAEYDAYRPWLPEYVMRFARND